MGFGGFEWLIILIIVLFLFGGKKIPQIARGLGRGIVEFRKGKDMDDDEISSDASGSGENRRSADEERERRDENQNY